MERSTTSDEIGASEAYAFLRALAPKLALLKQRLSHAVEKLNTGSPDEGRLDSLIEAQLALRDFLSGLSDFSSLVAPIDIVVDALREEAVEQMAPPPVEPVPVSPVPVSPVPAAPRAKPDASPEAWLRIGTVTAVQKLINAGMSSTNAEGYLASTYASIGLRLRDGTPISVELIKTWIGPRVGGWRRNTTMGRKLGGLAAPKGPGALIEAQSRVDELSAIFKRMAASVPQ